MKAIYNNWNEVTLGAYKKLAAISDDDSLSENEKQVAIAAVLCNVTPEEIWDMPMNDARALFSTMAWVNEFKPDFKKPEKKIYTLKGVKYDICYDVNKMTVAQYLDFQTYYKDGLTKDNMAEVLSCWMIPKGKKYNEGYDLVQTIADINDMPFIDVQRLCFFFLMHLETSIRAIRLFSRWMIRMELRKVKDPQKKAELQKQAQEIDNLFSYLSLTRWRKLLETHGAKSLTTK